MSEELKEESTRQCPACRNWVSYLATKCHYCGETLGRPRKEEIRKTIQDLGGESHSQYTISGNVMDALEAFREENLSETEGIRRQKEEGSQTWFGRRHTSDAPEGARVAVMPELAGEHKSLADDILGDNPPVGSRTTQRPIRRTNPDLVRNIVVGVIVVGVFTGVYFVGWPALQGYLAERNKPVVVEHVNLTRQKIDTGAPAIDVLRTAAEAADVAPTPENQALLEEARGYFETSVRALLDSDPFDDSKLGDASALMNQALAVDHSDRIQSLANEVSRDVAQHKFILTTVDGDSKKATFKLNSGSGQDEQVVSVGELLQDRFIVTAITSSSVRLEDTKRIVHGRQRPLVSRPFQAVSGS